MTQHYTAEQLVKQAARFARPKKGKALRWVVVRDLFSVGSTTATEICHKCGLNPDEVVKSG